MAQIYLFPHFPPDIRGVASRSGGVGRPARWRQRCGPASLPGGAVSRHHHADGMDS
jgi:hypothetical protein